MSQGKLIVAVACIGLAAGIAAPTTQAADGSAAATEQPAKHWKHPAMHAALHSLRQAKLELQAAPRDFGGHRKDAVKLVEDAILNVEEGLKLENDLPPATRPATQPSAPTEKDGQKLLQGARKNLRTAATELGKSAHEFSGHRTKALKATEDAIKHVEEALAVGK